MRRRAAVVFSILVATLGIEAAERLGRLCVDGSGCREAILHAEIVPVEIPRSFSWWNDTERVLVLGRIAPNASRVTGDAALGTMSVRLTSKAEDRWPADVQLQATNAEGITWDISLPRRGIERPVVLRLPAGKYKLRFSAARHQPAESAVTVTQELATTAVTLEPLPSIGGRVIEREANSPVPGATVALPTGEIVAVASGDGRFVFDAPTDAWPSAIVVTAAGYGTANVPLPRARATTILPDIEVGRGATVRVRVKRDRADEVRLSLHKRTLDRPDEAAVATAFLAQGSHETVLTNLDHGDYLLLAAGRESGQRTGRKLSIKEGETKEISFEIVERSLVVRTERAGKPLPRAEIALSNWDGLWNADVMTDDTGAAQVPVWQLGRFSAIVHESSLTSPHLERTTISESESEPSWTIRVSTREVSGTVVDAGTDKPIPHANVALRSRDGRSMTTKADALGRFRFSALPSGEHAVMAAADGYLPGRSGAFVDDVQTTGEVVVALTPADERVVIVKNASGRPLAGAGVIDMTAGTLTGERVTDGHGRVVIPLGANERRDLFIVPREGSFAVASLDSASRKEVEVVVPDARASIAVRAESTEGDPIRDVWVVVRYNGIVLPLEVQLLIARVQGAQTYSGIDGRITFPHVPPGLYELWPVGSPQELRQTMAGLGPAAPVKIVAQPGLNTATLRFSRR